MCTVSLSCLPGYNKGFVLTSNRDEAPQRLTIAPAIYREQGVKILFPKDVEGDGTWVGISEISRAICLLNGGRKAHKRAISYRHSRGIVVKDLLTASNLDAAIDAYDLSGIEPFTLISVDWNSELRFIELLWNGKQKHLKELELTTHLWSSAPLYDNRMKRERQQWFDDFLQVHPVSPVDFWKFHHKAGKGNKSYDIVMDRGFVKTKSITQIINTISETEMIHEDLQKNVITQVVLQSR